jgi:hypothetical protein
MAARNMATRTTRGVFFHLITSSHPLSKVGVSRRRVVRSAGNQGMAGAGAGSSPAWGNCSCGFLENLRQLRIASA